MLLRRRSVLLGAGAALLAACSASPAASPSPGGTSPVKITYGDDPSQVGELTLPPDTTAEGLLPVVVVVHGGYWRSAFGYDLGAPLAADLAAHGVAAWNIEYRRTGTGAGAGGGWPATFDDVAAAVDALAGAVQEAAGGRLDLGDVRGLGHSAGGHLAVWAAARHRLPTAAPGADPVVRFSRVVSQAGVLDLVGASEQSLGDGAADALLGGTPATQPERYAQASPTALVPIGVPVTCVHGEADVTVPISQSETYTAAATAAGDTATLTRLPGVDHFMLIDVASDAWATCRAAVLA